MSHPTRGGGSLGCGCRNTALQASTALHGRGDSPRGANATCATAITTAVSTTPHLHHPTPLHACTIRLSVASHTCPHGASGRGPGRSDESRGEGKGLAKCINAGILNRKLSLSLPPGSGGRDATAHRRSDSRRLRAQPMGFPGDGQMSVAGGKAASLHYACGALAGGGDAAWRRRV